MNNIQKSFKKKSELRCMADGGVVDHMSGKSREQQLKEATGHSIPAKAPGPGQPDFRNVKSTSQTTYGQKPKSALQRLFGMADGGEAPDGEIKGPGGPTDDKVGPVMLSDGEYVLPADTVEAIGKDKLDAIREATHKFVDSDDDGMANGGFLDEVTKRAKAGFSALRSAVTPAPAAPAPTPVRVNPGAGVDSRVGQAARGLAPVSEIPANRGMVPYQAATPSAAAPGRLARMAGGLRGMAGSAATVAPIAGFGDYKADVGGVDTSAAGTFGYMNRGEFDNMRASSRGGAAEALADSARGIAKTADGVAGIFGAQPGLTQKLDNQIADKFGGFLTLRNPDFSTVKGGSQTMQEPLRPVEAGVAGTGSRMASEKPPSGPQYYADLERQHQQELAQMRGGNREAGARAAVGGGPGAGQYPGLVENRSGLPNSAISGADPNSYYASRADGDIVGSFNGRNYTKKELDARGAGLATASGYAMKPEGDPAMAEIRSALRGIGGGGGGNWAPRSNAREINERYDALMRGGSGRNIVKGSDWSQRHGLAVESARAKELGDDASNQSTLRGQNMQAGASADQTRMSGITKMMELQAEREKNGAAGNAAALKAADDARKTTEQRQKDMTASAASVAETFGGGDKAVTANLKEVLSTLPPEMRAQIEGLTPDEREATYSNIAREHLGRTEGLVLGRDAGATVQNTLAGGVLGSMLRGGSGVGKSIDTALGKIPRVGPLLGALRPAENLARLGPLLGAGAGAYATPEVEGLDRWDPVARDPETGATIPTKRDAREAWTYGAWDTYLNPLDNAVQTRSGRRTDPPTPTEEEAARRRQSALRE